MNLSVHYPPHIRSRESSVGVMFDIMVPLLALYGMAVFFSGMRALSLGAVSVLCCMAADIVCQLVAGRGINIRDLSAAVTGLIIPLLMPASASYTMVVTASIFAIVVAKHPFGGVGQNIFNPAAAGVAFVMLCYPRAMFRYPPPRMPLPVSGELEVALERSAAYALNLGGVPTADFQDLLFGNVPGPMGTTHIIVLVCCFLYLWVRRRAKINMTAAFIGGATLYAMLFPRAAMAPIQSAGYELMSGMLLFAGIFMLSDPVTSPKRPIARTVYGFAAGMLCMLFRHLGNFEESVLFGILIMNAFVWLMDTRIERVYHRYRRERLEQEEPEAIPEAQE